MWKHRDLFADIVPRLDAFCIISYLLSVIGKQAVLRDVIIESGGIEERSKDGILTGKTYNRKVGFHKLIYEACMRLIRRGFMDWLEDKNFLEYQELDTFLSNNNNLSNNDVDSKILENDVLNAVHERFQQCMNKLGSDN